MEENELRIGIVGSRRRNGYTDRKVIMRLVHRLMTDNPHRKVTIVSGACPKGADHFAAEAARLFKANLKEFPVEKPPGGFHSKYEFAQEAFRRNEYIADDSIMGFAMVADDRKGGTENTVSHYLNKGKRVVLIAQDGSLYLPNGEAFRHGETLRDPDKD